MARSATAQQQENPVPPRERKRDRIVEDLKRRIAEGEFDESGRLPKKRELEEHYDASAGPVQAALDRLQWEGLVEGRQGKGWFLPGRANPSDPASPATG